MCDDQGSANQGAACARQAVSGGYLAVIGVSTATSPSIEPILGAAGIPIIGGVASANSDYTYQYGYFTIFPIVTIEAQLEIAAAVGAKKITFAAVDLPNVRSLVQTETAAASQFGLQVVNPVFIPPTATDLSSSRGAGSVVRGAGCAGDRRRARGEPADPSPESGGGRSTKQIRFISTTQILDNADLKTLGSSANGILTASAAWPTDDTSTSASWPTRVASLRLASPIPSRVMRHGMGSNQDARPDQ